MRWCKRVAGWLGTLLGTVGVAACLAGLIGVWILHARIQVPLNEITRALEEVGRTVEAHAQGLVDGVVGAREAVNELDQRVSERVRERLELTPADLERVDALQVQVRTVVRQVRAGAAFAAAAMGFVDQLVTMVQSTVGFFQTDPESREALRGALGNGREEIEMAAALMDEMADRLDELHAGADLKGGGEVLRSLSQRIDAVLGAVQDHGQAFADGVTEVTDGVVDVGDRIRRTLRHAALVLSVFLVWQVAAQISLAVHGWGLARGGPEQDVEQP